MARVSPQKGRNKSVGFNRSNKSISDPPVSKLYQKDAIMSGPIYIKVVHGFSTAYSYSRGVTKKNAKNAPQMLVYHRNRETNIL